MNVREVVSGAIGPYRRNCAGFLNRESSGMGYIATLKLSAGEVDMTGYDEGLARIVAYDRASRLDAYIGQLNVVAASSFCGLNGAVWGYDLVRAGDLHAEENRVATLTRHDGSPIDVWKIDPLLDATRRLFGERTNRRFNVLPGEVTVAAAKGTIFEGPTTIWAALGLAIAEDRTVDASLFVEDVPAEATEPPVDPLVIAKSMLACAQNQHALYKELFVGVKTRRIPRGGLGAVYAAAPYINLARAAVPDGAEPEDLVEMSLSEWERRMAFPPLPPYS